MLLSALPDAGRPAPRLYVLDGVAERVRQTDFRVRKRAPHLWSDLPQRLSVTLKRTFAEMNSNNNNSETETGQPDAKRRKVQNSISDLREQAEKAGFTPEDVQLFDQPYHDLCGELEHANEISYICEHGAPTERWGKNFRKLSVQNVEDKPAHRRRDPCVDLNPPPETAQPCPSCDGEGEDNNDYDSDDVDTGGQISIVEVDDEDGPVDRTVQIAGSASHLYAPSPLPTATATPTATEDEAGPSSPKPNNNNNAGKIVTPNKTHARAAMQLATRDIDNVVSSMLRPPDAKMSIFTRFLLSSMQPRRNMKVRLIIEDKTTGERKQVVRSVPHYLDSLKATANDPGTASSNSSDQQGVPAVHMHTRKWEENWLLRTPVTEWGERPCIKGEQCQGYAYCFDTKRALREYVSPREHAHWMTFGVWPHLGQPARQCLMCKRYGVSMDYWSSRAARRSANPTNQLLAEFYNLVNVPGEYHIGQCECNPGPYMGLWGPVAKHHLPNYTPVVTTLGAMIGRGTLMPSVAFKSQLPEHVLHRLEVVLFAQTGFVQIRERESDPAAVSTAAEGASLIAGREGAFISGSSNSIVAHFRRGLPQ